MSSKWNISRHGMSIRNIRRESMKMMLSLKVWEWLGIEVNSEMKGKQLILLDNIINYFSLIYEEVLYCSLQTKCRHLSILMIEFIIKQIISNWIRSPQFYNKWISSFCLEKWINRSIKIYQSMRSMVSLAAMNSREFCRNILLKLFGVRRVWFRNVTMRGARIDSNSY